MSSIARSSAYSTPDLSERRYINLLNFLNNSNFYQTDRLYSALPSDGGHDSYGPTDFLTNP